MATVGGQPGNACNKLTQDMGCYFGPGQTTGKGTVVKCDEDSEKWNEIQACAAGLICKEKPKPESPTYIKLAACEVDTTPATDGAGLGDAATPTDGGSTLDGMASEAGSQDAGGLSDTAGQDTAGQPDMGQPGKDSGQSDVGDANVDLWQPPQDTSDDVVSGVGCQGKCNSSSVDGDGKQCWCDSACHDNGDCCSDKLQYCPKVTEDDVTADVDMPDTSFDSSGGDVISDGGSGDGGGSEAGGGDGVSADAGTKPGTCKDRPCEFDGAQSCQCDDLCAKYGDCCTDKAQYCPPGS